jgi:hypothetical protein
MDYAAAIVEPLARLQQFGEALSRVIEPQTNARSQLTSVEQIQR